MTEGVAGVFELLALEASPRIRSRCWPARSAAQADSRWSSAATSSGGAGRSRVSVTTTILVGQRDGVQTGVDRTGFSVAGEMPDECRAKWLELVTQRNCLTLHC